jgi:hypothetical protein
VARTFLFAFPLTVAIYMPLCAPPVRPTVAPQHANQQMAELWRAIDVSAADLFNGPWGSQSAPNPRALYSFVKPKTHGHSPGLTVKDPEGTEWSVKQGDESNVEVTLSRVLSGLGYHQPPVYYLDAFPLDRGTWIEHAPGGRFRPKEKRLKESGTWSWQQNPFVGTKPYQGLLVILMMFNSSDLKNSNNSLYELKEPREGATRWFVVRDIGTALGETGKLAPREKDVGVFERHDFITGVKNGFVEFSYHGWHQELVRDRVTTADVRWACELMSKISDRQWADAFRAGGFDPADAQRYIAKLKAKIVEGLGLTGQLPKSAGQPFSLFGKQFAFH